MKLPLAFRNAMFYNIYLMKSKKILLFTITSIFCLILLTGCGTHTSAGSPDSGDKISIVCTTFPQYDWVRGIIGSENETFRLTLLLDTGVDPHSYQPTARDIAMISSADLFIYTGGESEQWAEDILKEPFNPDLQAVSLLETLGDTAKEEETVEGMQERLFCAEDDETEYDEHVWLSLKNAAFFVSVLRDAVSSLDEANAALYTENANKYIHDLNKLDLQYEQCVSSARFDTLLFGDRFPFRYLTEDYGIHYYAAFPGCSAETEAGFETITFLSEKLDALHLGTILVIENSDTRIAETIRENTVSKDQKILMLNSIQSVTKAELESGFTYLGAMQDNLETLRQALNQ